jgi:hypothetical protein
MSKTILVTVSDEAADNLRKVQDRITKIRRVNNPKASASNQHDAVSWVLENTLLPVTL